MAPKKNDKKDKVEAAPARVIVTGEPADSPAIPARTPRDVAIQKTREGEDVGLESSKPDLSEPPIRLSARVLASGTFIDVAGNEWSKTGKNLSKAAVLDPDAIKKDGGDPGVLNIPPHRVGERYHVDNPGNESFSPEGVFDPETGETRDRTVEEGGIVDADRPKPTLAENAVKLTADGGRGGSSAKSKANKTARGKAK